MGRAITWTPELAATVADLANDAEQTTDARNRAREIAWNAYAGLVLEPHHVGYVSALRQRLTGHTFAATAFEAAWRVANGK